MSLEPVSKVDKTLVVVAHPDDVDFGSAGSVARWVNDGTEVAYLVITDGDAGGFELDTPRNKIPSIRREEQRAAAKVVGVDQVDFLGYPDGLLTPSLDLRRDISRVIRRFRPDRVVCQSPERNYLRLPASHPDHMAAGTATICSVYPDARNPFAHPELLQEEGLDAFIVKEVLIQAHPELTVYQDVTDTFDKKIEAILCHKSQLPDPQSVSNMVRSWLSMGAQNAGLDEGRLAESYFRVTL